MNLMTPALLAQLNQYIEADNVQAWYHLRYWRYVKAYVMKRDHHECQVCRKRGLYTPANTVHHLQHVLDRPDLALDTDNLEVVCRACHNREHPEKLSRFKKKKFDNVERW